MDQNDEFMMTAVKHTIISVVGFNWDFQVHLEISNISMIITALSRSEEDFFSLPGAKRQKLI